MKFMVMLLLIGFTGKAYSQQAQDINGTWLGKDGDGKIKIFQSGDYFYGTIVWLKTPNNPQGQPKMDDKNPDVSARNRHLQGLMILKGFVYNPSTKKYEHGEIYDPKSGKTYQCVMYLKDATHLAIRGFIGISLIGRTEEWTRAD